MDISRNDIVRPDVLDYETLCELVPFFKGKKRLANFYCKLLGMDKVNKLHRNNCNKTGAKCAKGALKDLDIVMTVENEDHLDSLPEGAFITISNHPFGALDGIMLVSLLASRRKDYKVIVHLILTYVTALRNLFIPVDPNASDDPYKKSISMRGIREAIKHVREGHPIGIFPAGTVARVNRKLEVADNKWQPTIVRMIQQLKVPVVPIYFHGKNSLISYLLGNISIALRALLLPSEIFRKKGSTMRITVGKPISVEEQAQYETLEEYTAFLKERTFAMKY